MSFVQPFLVGGRGNVVPFQRRRKPTIAPEDANHIAEAIDTARMELVRHAMRRLDQCRECHGAADLHLLVGEEANRLEELMRELVRVTGEGEGDDCG